MTQLHLIDKHHISLFCQCGHDSAFSVLELLERLRPDTTVNQVANKARCTVCGRKGNKEFRLYWKCRWGHMSDNKQAPRWFRGIFYVVLIAVISCAIVEVEMKDPCQRGNCRGQSQQEGKKKPIRGVRHWLFLSWNVSYFYTKTVSFWDFLRAKSSKDCITCTNAT